MLCRVADNIFWMGRYVERAISVGRLIGRLFHPPRKYIGVEG